MDNYFALVIGRTHMIFYLGWNPFVQKSKSKAAKKDEGQRYY